MNRHWFRFVLGAVTGLAVAAACNLVPYWRSYQAYRYDGYEVAGFPLVFRREGGFAYRYEIHPEFLLANIAIAVAFALFSGWAALKLPQLVRRPTRGFTILPRSDGGAKAE